MAQDPQSRTKTEPRPADPAHAQAAAAGIALEPNPEAQRRSTLEVSGLSPGVLAGDAPADGPPLGPGSMLEHYEIVRELGRGGMGIVFLARDTRLARLCAIKLLLRHTGASAGRFLAEARATARCRHESIVIVYEVDELRGYPYMVLEYLEGRTLRAWMTEGAPGEPVPPRRALELVLPVVRALACAHEMGIVHRDLKPENIFLTDAGQVKVLDFGIARRLAPDEDPGSTAHRAIAGTPLYMAPEQWLGRDIGPETDLWALGVILFELVTGSHPLAPAALQQLLAVQDLERPMPSVRERLPDVGPLGDIIDRCLTKHRTERSGSARELLAELEPLASGRKAPARTEDESPFTGLAAFQEADAERFFGRERDVAAVLSRLRQQQLVAIAGPSGAGKSSFVRAGVIPALKRSDGDWEVFTVRPGRRPLASLADVLVHAGDAAGPDGLDALAVTLRDQPGHLGATLRARCRHLGKGHRILLFVDQFEELYTLGIASDERTAFLSCLEGVADDASSPLRVVLAARSDFLDRIAADGHFMTEVTRGLVFLPPLGRDGLRDALTRPLDAAAYRYETDELIEQVLDALEHTSCPLPILQFTAARLWESRDRERRLVTQGSYDALGGIVGALAAHADAVLAALAGPEQRLARAILLRLVTPERTRALASMAELRELAGDNDAAEQVVQHLVGARLLLVESGGEQAGATVQLVHESLIDTWPRLRSWLDEDEQEAQFLARVRAAAQPWEASGEPEGLLWRGRAAEDARRWLDRRRAAHGAELPSGLGRREERYLLAVVALAERARRWRRRAVVGVMAALAAVAVIVSYLALRASEQARRADEQARYADEQAGYADEQATRARTEAQQSRNAARIAAARELKDDPTTALVLLREVEPPEVPRRWFQLARRALQDGVARLVFEHEDEVTSAAFSPDGKRIVTASTDKAARVWSADGTGQPLVLLGHGDFVFSVAWSPDGKHIATASWDRTARVWSADGTGQPLVLRGHESRVWSVAWSPDSKRIVTASEDGTARVWSADGTGQPLVFHGHTHEVVSAAFSPDGKRIVTASKDGTARVWNADATGQPVVFRGHDAWVWSAAWSPDGKRIVTASHDKTARIWSADGTGAPVVLHGHLFPLTSAAFSPDGKRILTASHDETVRVYSTDDVKVSLILRGHKAQIISAAWSPDGKCILTASSDKTARVYIVERDDLPLILRGHQDQVVVSATFSPDGKRILTASNDKTARVWSADGTAQLRILRGHSEGAQMGVIQPRRQAHRHYVHRQDRASVPC